MSALVVVLSVLVGLSLGLLGGGGSILTVPVLRYGARLDAHVAIAVSLFVVSLTSLAALVPHALGGRVRWRTGVSFGLAGMAGAYPAGRLAKLLPATLLLSAFGAVMLATAIAMLRRKPAGEKPAPPSDRPMLRVLGEGVVVGAVTGLVGAGGGFLVVPALVLLGGLPMQAAVGTSLLVIFMKSAAGFAGFLGHTPIDWTLALAVGGAAIAGSVIGSALTHRVSPDALRAGFAWFVIAMAWFVFAQELPSVLGWAPALPTALALSIAITAVLALAVHVSKRFRGRPRTPEIPAGGAGTFRVTPELRKETP